MKHGSLIFFSLLLVSSGMIGFMPPAAAIVATGGTATMDGGTIVRTFTSSGFFCVTSGSGTVNVFVLAGGGGGDRGGGGGGGYRTNSSYPVNVGCYTVTIGAGGAAATANDNGANGGNSVFGNLTSTGGGAGRYTVAGVAGGSGGGGGGVASGGGAASPAGQGSAGGTGANAAGGGGGGAGAVGANASPSNGGNGGTGLSNSYSGSSICYGGGGGGGGDVTAGTATCGGGAGAASGASSGTANRGGGGGGVQSAYPAGSGSSGIVIVRYALAGPDPVTTLHDTDISTTSVDLAWTAPSMNGGTCQGYRINYTTPWGQPNTVLLNSTGSCASTAYTVSPLALATDYSFRVSAITQAGGNINGANILNVTTLAFNQANFTVGNLSFDADNSDVIPIFFERTDINSTSLFLNVTYPNTWELACDFHYKFAMTNQTYNNLTSVPVGATDDVESSFELLGANNEVINVRCWDRNGTGEGRYLITQTNFPLFQYITKFSNGHYGTSGDFATFDFVYLAVIIVSLVGLNRTNESVGAGFMIVITAAMAYFHFITIPTAAISGIGLAVMLIIITTRKD